MVLMMNMKRRVFLAAGAAFTAVSAHQLSGCARFQSQGDKVLNLYSARHYDTDNQVYEGFFKRTGVRVNLVEAPGDKLIERLKSEGANSPADVVITVDAGNLWRMQQEGLFQKIPDSSQLFTKIPANLRDPDGYWFGLTKRARVILYNKERVNPSDITRYEDLADAKWRGKVIVRSSNNVYNQSLVGSMIAAQGEAKTEAWARGLVANFARKPEGNDTAQIKAVASGIGDLTLSNTYYLVRLANSSNPEDRQIAAKIGVIFPNQSDRGTHVNISGGGVARYAPNREAAIQFLEYLITPEAQQIFAASNHEYPVIEGVALDPILAGFGRFKADPLSAKTFGALNPAALKLMDRAGWV